MTSALVIAAPGAPALEADLYAVGIVTAAQAQPDDLIRSAARCSADLLVAWDPYPAQQLLPALAALQDHVALPVLLFTSDTDAATLSAALRAGVHAYVVNGYAPARLRPLVQLAQARFEHDREQRQAHQELTHRFEERKLVDRAKGILMRSRRIPEDEAFRLLRAASMEGQQRVGLVSRRLIDAARDAEAINRAGQLRMLSQHLVKLYALQCAGVDAAGARNALRASTERVVDNLDLLERSLSQPTFGDLLQTLRGIWQKLAPALASTPQLKRLAALDTAAEQLMQSADQLTAALEAGNAYARLALVNLVGRQRMLSQRIAKQALLATLLDGPVAQAAVADAVHTIGSFETAQARLLASAGASGPLFDELQHVAAPWQQLLKGLHDAASESGRRSVAEASESLLTLFDRMTEHCEQAAHVLIEPTGDARAAGDSTLPTP
ncbi:MAG: type IV pili methyl-accepting chemotaxis transducer N-terminal domain-containing protein [Burkholderiaceae bacterium]|nr:type IV pili methyl-accepting chemotaxis transducer N-terminal domain-containing protein [Burkholderiaceae bacterium]